MRFKGIDLNLFVVFDALMETRSTARAGDRIGISQPAASSALARLRDYFGDELLVVQGRKMFPTPFAESLLPRVRECLRQAEEALTSSSGFFAETAEREFRIVASDYVVAAILAPLAISWAERAPGLRFQFILTDEHATEKLRRGQVDLQVTPTEYAIPGVPTEPLYDERYVLAGWRRHPIFEADFDLEQIFEYGHVAVAVGSERLATVGDRQIEQLGYRRRVEVTASAFTVLPWLLVGTQRLALMHRRLAALCAEHFDITYAEIPAALQPLKQLVQYHQTRASDPAIRWLIDEIKQRAGDGTAAR
jgi:DNA-binding transcriptional LysR family regulator